MYTVEELEDKLIDLAFAEDIGDGDHTTLCCIPEDAMGKSHLLIKEDGILAGVEVAKKVFDRFDNTMKVEVLIGDGAEVKKGDIAMVVTGKVRSLLQTERLMLNIMQRMSGIATMTHKYVEKLKGTKTHVLDTRKICPGAWFRRTHDDIGLFPLEKPRPGERRRLLRMQPLPRRDMVGHELAQRRPPGAPKRNHPRARLLQSAVLRM